MPLIANKPKAKKGNAIIGDATDRLLRAAKEKILREKGRIDYDQLRQEGFTAEMIARLKALWSCLAISAELHELFDREPEQGSSFARDL